MFMVRSKEDTAQSTRASSSKWRKFRSTRRRFRVLRVRAIKWIRIGKPRLRLRIEFIE
jgi:hypothetical protein